MKIAIFGKTPESKAQLNKAVKKSGFIYDEKKPDLIISYGGDGTFLWAERKYPGVPKVLFRFSKICNKCHNLPVEHALALLKKKKYKIKEHTKLQGKLYKTTTYATNDITIRNAVPTHAIRFELYLNGKKYKEEFIGDGLVIATTFGSTGYYESITRKNFKKGIGIAFNNTTTKQKHLVVPEKTKIKVKITRGEALVATDNEPKLHLLIGGKSITITKSKKKAKLVSF